MFSKKFTLPRDLLNEESERKSILRAKLFQAPMTRLLKNDGCTFCKHIRVSVSKKIEKKSSVTSDMFSADLAGTR